jgi:hypothetical protein
VYKEALARGLKDHLLEDITSTIILKRKGGERITLLEAAPTLYPSPRNPIEEDCRLTGLVEHLDPSAPKLREPFGQQDTIQSVPANGFKGFAEIKLEDYGSGSSFVIALDDVGSVHKVYGRDKDAADSKRPVDP